MIYGFNPNNCFLCLNELKLSYIDLYYVLNDQIEKLILNELSSRWACEHSVSFAMDAKKVIENTINNKINPIFEKIIGTINNISISLAINTKTEFSNIFFETKKSNINIGNINEIFDNKKGIDLISVRDLMKSGFDIIDDLVNKALGRAKKAINSYQGFYGELSTNKESIYHMIDLVSLNVNELINKLKELINNSVNLTVRKYGYTMFSIV